MLILVFHSKVGQRAFPKTNQSDLGTGDLGLDTATHIYYWMEIEFTGLFPSGLLHGVDKFVYFGLIAKVDIAEYIAFFIVNPDGGTIARCIEPS